MASVSVGDDSVPFEPAPVLASIAAQPSHLSFAPQNSILIALTHCCPFVYSLVSLDETRSSQGQHKWT